jgi:hypothetical protein
MNAANKGYYEVFQGVMFDAFEVRVAAERDQDNTGELAARRSESILRKLLQFRKDAGLLTIEQIDADNRFAEQQRIYDDLDHRR